MMGFDDIFRIGLLVFEPPITRDFLFVFLVFSRIENFLLLAILDLSMSNLAMETHGLLPESLKGPFLLEL